MRSTACPSAFITFMKNTKKLIIIILASVAAVTLLLLGMIGVSALLSPRVDTVNLTGVTDVSLAEADYNENIFEDTAYTSKQRDVFFTYDGDGEFITSENYLTFSPAGEMFYNYFGCVINGDYSLYPSFFSESFKKNALLPEKFTMQKLYDISVTLESREIVDNGYTELYSVRYRIMDNNGTFRSDLKNGTVIPVYYTVFVTNTSAQIVGISVPTVK